MFSQSKKPPQRGIPTHLTSGHPTSGKPAPRYNRHMVSAVARSEGRQRSPMNNQGDKGANTPVPTASLQARSANLIASPPELAEKEADTSVPTASLETRSGNLLSLPPELLDNVFSYILAHRDEVAVRLTCRTFRKVWDAKQAAKIDPRVKELSARIEHWIEKTNTETLQVDHERRSDMKAGFDRYISSVTKAHPNLEPGCFLTRFRSVEMFTSVEELFVGPWFLVELQRAIANDEDLKHYDFLKTFAKQYYLEGIDMARNAIEWIVETHEEILSRTHEAQIAVALSCRPDLFDEHDGYAIELEEKFSDIKHLLSHCNFIQQNKFFALFENIGRYYVLLAFRNLLLARVSYKTTKVENFETKLMAHIESRLHAGSESLGEFRLNRC